MKSRLIPAALAAGYTLRQAGYPVLILERGQFAAGVANWPVYMKLFSTTDLVELGEEITRVEPGQSVGFLSYSSLI